MIDTCHYMKYNDCIERTIKTFNLKDFYDVCEQEISYNNVNRRSDLKFSSSQYPNRAPLYLEIYVTHASDDTKLHSGSKIIEAKIENEEDIDEIIGNGFIESPKQNDYDRNDNHSLKISLGGKNKDYNITNCSEEIEFSRYILYQSDKFQCRQESCNCKKLRKFRFNSLYEICFHTPVAFGIHEIAKWMGFRKFGIRNCLMCKNYVENYYGDKLCCLYKHLGISRNEPHDTARVKICNSFILNKEEMNECLQKVDNKEIPPITEFD